MKKIIELAESPIYSYTKHSYSLSLSMKEPKTMEWFYCNYIQLVCNKKREGLFFDFLSYCSVLTGDPWIDSVAPGNPWIQCEQVPGYTIKGHCDQVIDMVKWAIDRDRIVVTVLDDYYLPNKAFYQNKHNLHEILCYGYDDETQMVHTLSFDEQSNFGEFLITYDNFIKAYDTIELFYPDDPDRINPIKYYQLNQEFEYHFDIQTVRNGIAGLLYSKNTLADISSMRNFSSDLTFGIETYQTFRDYYTDMSGGQDLRPIQVLVEHKKCMMMRLEYMADLYNSDRLRELTERYRFIEEKCESIKRYLIKSFYLNRLSKQVEPLMDTVFTEEPPILKDILDAIDEIILQQQ